MNILVTGSQGYIGKNICSYLFSIGYNIIQCDPKINGKGAQHLSEFDLKDINFIIHLGALSGVQDCEENQVDAYHNNVLATINIANIANKLRIPAIIFSSGAAEYPEVNWYARTKWMCEEYVKNNDNVIVFRPTNIYGGIGYLEEKTSVVSKFLNAKLNNEKITIYGDGYQVRDFIHVDHVCEMILTCMSDKKEFFENYKKIPISICTGKGTTIKELANLFNIENIEYKENDSKVGVKSSVGDNTIIKKYIDFDDHVLELKNYYCSVK